MRMWCGGGRRYPFVAPLNALTTTVLMNILATLRDRL